MKIRALVVGWVGGLGCTPVVAPPLVAPAGLDATLDPGEGVVVEDDARRHAAPAGMMRRRVYAVERGFVRWYPPTRGQTGPWWLPPLLPDHPQDRVALRGGPAPAPGQRFVLFGDEGPRGVVEATGERCPPGHTDCVACAADDLERLHWARFVGAVPEGRDDASHALGPFEPGEPLPTPRWLGQTEARQVGRWKLYLQADLDGDGAADVVWASTIERTGTRRFESWRLYEGRWYAEPPEPRPSVPMHVLDRTIGLGSYDLEDGWVGLPGSGLDGFSPAPGEYRIVGARGELGRVRLPERSEQHHCFWWDGPPCHPAQWTSPQPRKVRGPTVIVGPIDPAVAVRSVKVARPWWETRRWEPDRAQMEVAVELADGRHWTITRRPCAWVGRDQTLAGWCHEGREDRGESTPRRWMSAEFRFLRKAVV